MHPKCRLAFASELCGKEKPSFFLCSFDFLTIANDTNHVFGKYCGEKTGKTVMVTGQFVVITFHTDAAVEERGFELLFNPVPLGE